MADTQPVPSNSVTSSEELNPLLNPVLEHNLSRWAHVYFTTPPERRDEAVRDLLRELRSEPKPAAPPQPESPLAAPSAPSQAEIICPSCRGANRSGERFCGFCGAFLEAETPAPFPSRASEPAPEEPVGETFSFLGLAPDRSDNNLEFLREKSSGPNYYEPEPESHRGRILVIAALLVLVGLTYVSLPYLRSHVPALVQRYRASVQSPPVQAPAAQTEAAAPPATQEPTASTSSAAAGNVPQNSNPRTVEPPAPTKEMPPPAPASNDSAKAVASKSAADSLTLAAKTEPDAIADNGGRELAQAQQYLDGRGVPHDSTQAVALLWKAVGKQNTHAEVLLADLYMLGDGVPKSCDQARLLLVAAAKKGAPDATRRLQDLETNGCR